MPPVLTYFHGGFEAGGRFVDRPPSGFGRAPNGDFLTPSQTQSRAKFEEYGEVRSAPMLDWINLQFGTTDGRYAVDFWGKNVGLDNQSYWLDIAKPGEHYLTFGYDETPRLFSTSAKTLFRGTPTFLTVPDARSGGVAGAIAQRRGEHRRRSDGSPQYRDHYQRQCRRPPDPQGRPRKSDRRLPIHADAEFSSSGRTTPARNAPAAG